MQSHLSVIKTPHVGPMCLYSQYNAAAASSLAVHTIVRASNPRCCHLHTMPPQPPLLPHPCAQKPQKHGRPAQLWMPLSLASQQQV